MERPNFRTNEQSPSGLIIAQRQMPPNVERILALGVHNAIPRLGDGSATPIEQRLFLPTHAIDELIRSPYTPQEIIKPTDTQVQEHIASTPKKRAEDNQQMNVANRVRALYNPGVYFARTLHTESTTEEEKEVLTNLTVQYDSAQPEQYTPSAIARQTKTESFFVHHTGTVEERTTSLPSPLESVSTRILEHLQDPTLRGMQARVVLQPVLRLVRNYNLRINNGSNSLPLPDLRERAINFLPVLAGRENKDARFAMYSILEHVDMNVTSKQREALMRYMDIQKDLDHPLAYALTFAIAAENPHSDWIRIQTERRQELLSQLTGTNQAIFDHADDLFKLSQGLVFHGDHRTPADGKIGIDMESIFPALVAERAIFTPEESDTTGMATSEDYTQRVHGLEKNWAYHQDCSNNELTRGDNRLEHTNDYAASLVELHAWLNKNQVHVLGWHLHLDNDRHPFAPTLGGLLHTASGSIRDNPLKTKEIRALQIPRAFEVDTNGMNRSIVLGDNLHPARMEDIIGLYIAASTQQAAHNYDKKIHIDNKVSDLTLEKIMLGHIASYVTSPEGRLAALMALHGSEAFNTFNPVAFLNSYDRDSLAYVVACTENRVEDHQHAQTLVDIVRAAANGTLAELYALLSERKEHPYTLLVNGIIDPTVRANGDIFIQLAQDPSAHHIAVESLLMYPVENRTYLINLLQNPETPFKSHLFGKMLPHISKDIELMTSLVRSDDKSCATRVFEVMTKEPATYQDVIRSILADDTYKDFHYRAFEAICGLPHENHDIIVDYLHREDHSLSWNAFQTVCKYPDEFRTELISIIDSELPGHQRADALSRVTTNLEESRDVVIRASTSTEHAVRSRALSIMIANGDMFEEVLLRAIKEDDYLLKSGAMGYFAQHADKYQEVLSDALSSKDYVLSQPALKVFKADPIKYQEILERTFDSDNQSMQREVMESFAAQPKLFREILLRGAGDRHNAGYSGALDGLARDEQNIEVLTTMLEETRTLGSYSLLEAIAAGLPEIRQLLLSHVEEDTYVSHSTVTRLLKNPIENTTILLHIMTVNDNAHRRYGDQVAASFAQHIQGNVTLMAQLLFANIPECRELAITEFIARPAEYADLTPTLITYNDARIQHVTHPPIPQAATESLRQKLATRLRWLFKR